MPQPVWKAEQNYQSAPFIMTEDWERSTAYTSPTSERSPQSEHHFGDQPNKALHEDNSKTSAGVSSPLLTEETLRGRNDNHYTTSDEHENRVVVYGQGLGDRTSKQTVALEDRPGTADVSKWELAALTCFNVPYGLLCSTFGMLVLPHECSRFAEKNSGDLLSFSFLLVGLSQLVCPLAGRWSDAHSGTTRLSKREPYIVAGAIIGCTSCLGLWYASHYVMMSLYMTCLFLSVVGLNIIYSVQSCLPSDLIAVELHGASSGYVALLALAGGQFGFFILIITSMFSIVASTFIYPLVIVTVIISCIVLLIVARRIQQRVTSKHLVDDREYYQTCPAPTSRECIAAVADPVALSVDFEFGLRSISACAETRAASAGSNSGEHLGSSSGSLNVAECSEVEEKTLRQRMSKLRIWKDFAFVFFSRTFYYIAISCQAFMLFYTRDILETTEEAQQEIRVALMVFLSQGTAAMVAVPCGTYSDRKDVSKKRLIYYSCFVMSLVYAWFIIVPKIIPPPNTFYGLLPGSILYGAGSGCFLAIDYALALAATPTASQSGQALGLWGVSFFIGASIGPILWARCLAAFSEPSVLGYSYRGYSVMLFGGMVSTLLSAGLVAFIRGVH